MVFDKDLVGAFLARLSLMIKANRRGSRPKEMLAKKMDLFISNKIENGKGRKKKIIKPVLKMAARALMRDMAKNQASICLQHTPVSMF